MALQLLALLALLLALSPPAQAAGDFAARQEISLGHDRPYRFAVYANQALPPTPNMSRTAVVVLHGVKRNADDYFAIGQTLLKSAGMAPDTLLVAPNFMTRNDAGASDAMPLWGGGKWMQGDLSEHGVQGLSSFEALDDIVLYLANRAHFPQLREVVLIGHSAGAQLMQRYAVLNQLDERMQAAGIHLRYVISSPSSYLYFDAMRPDGDGFALPKGNQCPGYDNYRYGIGNPPDYLKRQALDGRQLFARYAARDITYLVGQRDDDPNHRFLDRACGAALQGKTRVERQLNFVRYEQLLAMRWNLTVQHPEFEIEGAAHSAERLYRSPATARRMLGQ
ncbi:alpha/beta fold hydrolase [Herbaspirillum sp. alder98]|uniref:alpha/beta fold hydrolase n=1 Tax=Herbaspirillum sp. alder98 TaxID=2913096 RepID=UPI001CD8266B|nr:alpha/beta fold hydrolase [Herbaspirillum sp. alder98]MCA1323966.1 alpha/beta fold hydrolase [Herbaspirillum sp. alder98]